MIKNFYNWLAFFYAILLLFFPLCFAFTACNDDYLARIFVSFIYSVVVGVTLYSSCGRLRLFLAVVYTILAVVPNVVVLSYLRMDAVIMKSADFWVVFNTNPTEASNMFSMLSADVLVCDFIYFLVVIAGLVAVFLTTKKDRAQLYSCKRKRFVVGCLVFLTAISVINPFRSKVPMLDFYKSYYKYSKEQRELAEFYANRKNLILDVTCHYPDGQNTLLFIVGESQNRIHMQLFGYPRPTNPLLTEIKDELYLYPDVCSPAVHTLACMKQILTFSNNEHPDLFKKEANIIELLRSGGYKTFWLDNQGKTKNQAFMIDTYTPTSYRVMARMSDVYFESEGLDSVLLPQLELALSDTACNKAIFLHLIGNHFDYSQRYEQNFNYFIDSSDIASPYMNKLTESDVKIINSYDNATRYNDYIVRSCIEALRKAEGRSAMLYLSDHGEEIFDYQCYFSRSFEKISPSMCEPAFLLWMNDDYEQSNDLSIDPKRPLCTDDVIFAMMDLAGIHYHLYDSTSSILREEYVPKERYVCGIKYRDIKKQNGRTEMH